MSRSAPRRSIHLLAAGMAAVLTLGLTMGPALSAASATGQHSRPGTYVQPPTPYDNSGTFDPECADVAVEVTYRYRGVDSIRRVPGTDGQAFFYKDAFRFSETWTDTSNDKVLFTQRGRYRYEEVKAKQVPASAVPADAVPPEGLVGPIYRFTSVETGSDKLRDARGRTLYRTAGLVVFSSLFDTLGDRAPGGTTLTFDPVKVVGPHPLLDVDLCDVAAAQAR